MTQSLPRVDNTEVYYFLPRYRQLISFASRIYCHDVDCVTHRHVPASGIAAAGYTCYHPSCCYQYSSHFNKYCKYCEAQGKGKGRIRNITHFNLLLKTKLKLNPYLPSLPYLTFN